MELTFHVSLLQKHCNEVKNLRCWLAWSELSVKNLNKYFQRCWPISGAASEHQCLTEQTIVTSHFGSYARTKSYRGPHAPKCLIFVNKITVFPNVRRLLKLERVISILKFFVLYKSLAIPGPLRGHDDTGLWHSSTLNSTSPRTTVAPLHNPLPQPEPRIHQIFYYPFNPALYCLDHAWKSDPRNLRFTKI